MVGVHPPVPFSRFGWAMFNLFIDFVSTRCANISLWLGNVQFVHLSVSFSRGAVAALVGAAENLLEEDGDGDR